jgi:hypothetical protein
MLAMQRVVVFDDGTTSSCKDSNRVVAIIVLYGVMYRRTSERPPQQALSPYVISSVTYCLSTPSTTATPQSVCARSYCSVNTHSQLHFSRHVSKHALHVLLHCRRCAKASEDVQRQFIL